MTKLLFGFLLALTVVAATPSVSHAARVPFVFNSGQKIFRTGPLPEPFDKEEELQGYDAGYACDIKGVMWSYYSVTNCKPVAFQGDSYVDEEHLTAAIAAKYPESSMQRGLWGHYGWMLFLLAIVGGLAIWIKELLTGKKTEDATAGAPQGPVDTK